MRRSFAMNGALAIAILTQVSPVRAEAVTLICQNNNASSYTGSSSTFRVDYDRRIVELLGSDGSAVYGAAATITEGSIDWRATLDRMGGAVFSGSLNRLSGEIWGRHPVRAANGQVLDNIVSGTCRRATQKF